jgi:hypothetical protein
MAIDGSLLGDIIYLVIALVRISVLLHPCPDESNSLIEAPDGFGDNKTQAIGIMCMTSA